MIVRSTVLRLLWSVRAQWHAHHMIGSSPFFLNWGRLNPRCVLLRRVIVCLVHMPDGILMLIPKEEMLLIKIIIWIVARGEDELGVWVNFYRWRFVVNRIRFRADISPLHRASLGTHYVNVGLRTFDPTIQEFRISFRLLIRRGAPFDKYLLGQSLVCSGASSFMIQLLGFWVCCGLDPLIGRFVELPLVKHGDHTSVLLPLSPEIVNECFSLVECWLLLKILFLKILILLLQSLYLVKLRVYQFLLDFPTFFV